jgi:nitrite reductase/ring-hydroxylating ferredoxin subunit
MSVEAEELEVFVICPVRSIGRGEAKAFSLSRLNEEGDARPFSIVVIRTNDDAVVGYVNSCPHARIWLNFGAGEFFNADRTLLKCGRHGSLFEIETGVCVDGPCNGKSLEPIALAVVDGEICLCGVTLVEDNRFPNPFEEEDDTMEIMIHPD